MQTCSLPIHPLTDASALVNSVQRDGWVKSTAAEFGHDPQTVAGAIARLLGHVIEGRNGQTVEVLTPQKQASARTRSLSVVHGLGSFPMHTDGAHRLQPPHFVVLICDTPGSSPVPTTLVRFQDLKISLSERVGLEAAPFLVRNGRRSFYSTIYGRSRPFIRFDEGCMMPLGAESKAVHRLVTERVRTTDPFLVNWHTGDVLIIDNWNVLHGRGLGSDDASTDRKILRVSVQ
jgi:hypothetical protein